MRADTSKPGRNNSVPDNNKNSRAGENGRRTGTGTSSPMVFRASNGYRGPSGSGRNLANDSTGRPQNGGNSRRWRGNWRGGWRRSRGLGNRNNQSPTERVNKSSSRREPQTRTNNWTRGRNSPRNRDAARDSTLHQGSNKLEDTKKATGTGRTLDSAKDELKFRSRAEELMFWSEGLGAVSDADVNASDEDINRAMKSLYEELEAWLRRHFRQSHFSWLYGLVANRIFMKYLVRSFVGFGDNAGDQFLSHRFEMMAAELQRKGLPSSDYNWFSEVSKVAFSNNALALETSCKSFVASIESEFGSLSPTHRQRRGEQFRGILWRFFGFKASLECRADRYSFVKFLPDTKFDEETMMNTSLPAGGLGNDPVVESTLSPALYRTRSNGLQVLVRRAQVKTKRVRAVEHEGTEKSSGSLETTYWDAEGGSVDTLDRVKVEGLE